MISNMVKGIKYFPLFLVAASCEDFVDVHPPKTQVSSENVFASDATAISAINGIYSEMMSSSGFASGGLGSVTLIAGLSSDDFVSTLSGEDHLAFYQVSILPNNAVLTSSLWSEPYKYIYYCNSLLEGLRKGSQLSSEVKGQLKGEALFIRAFSYFYLINMFGDVPLVTTTNFETNTNAPRAAKELVFAHIITDLKDAQSLLSEEYPVENERIRPNKGAATALLSRVYLYNKDWANADIEASAIINNSSLYSLDSDLNSVFLTNGSEAIWQLKPVLPTLNTFEGNLFILMDQPANSVYLNPELVNSFETTDKRKDNWIGSITVDDVTYYYPFKYKISGGDVVEEYSMVLRLAEQYLIRAEARANLGNLSGAIEDIDLIRFRAGLDLINNTNPSINQMDLLLAIENERRLEFFSEWGHRWFDLKRNTSLHSSGGTRADDVLATKKGQSFWQGTDILYPIPLLQIQNDPIMANSQNPGY